jgi:hypothetical protein
MLKPITAATLLATIPALAPAAAFPDAWQGIWKAQAEARGADPERAPMTFTMELHVGPLEAGLAADPKPRRTWTIIYDGKQGRQERKYHLVDRDAGKGLYEIDEQNSIVLPATLVGESLVCPFEIDGSMLVTTYRFDAAGEGPDDDRIIFEIVTFPTAKPENTGGKDGVPEVKGYVAASVQRAVLKRAAAGEVQQK